MRLWSRQYLLSRVPACIGNTGLILAICFSAYNANIPAASAQENIPLSRLVFEAAVIPVTSTPVDFSAAPTEQDTTIATQNNPLHTFNSLLNNISQYEDKISQLELESGAYAQNLPEQLFGLGAFYQQQGKHELAIEAFERAIHVNRVNYGLNSLEQINHIKALVPSLLALGETKKADEQQQYLVYLNQQNYGWTDPRTTSSLINLGDWNLQAFFTRVADFSPIISVGFSANSDGSFAGSSPSPRQMAFGKLYQARMNYYTAITTLISNQKIFDPALPELESNLVETIFLQAHRRGILEDPEFYMTAKYTTTGSLVPRGVGQGYSINYKAGVESYERTLIYLTNNTKISPAEVATKILEKGDWALLFGRHLSGLRVYQEAYVYLIEQGLSENAIAQILSPEIPVQIPTFTDLPHSRNKFGIAPEQQLDYDGYIDISFEVGRYGAAKKFSVIGGSANATSAMEKRLKRLIYSAKYRPRFTDDKTRPIDTISLRYYFMVT